MQGTVDSVCPDLFSLIHLDNHLLAELLLPVNHILSVLTLALIALRSAYQRIFTCGPKIRPCSSRPAIFVLRQSAPFEYNTNNVVQRLQIKGKKMTRAVILVACLTLMSGCIATHERPMNKGEDTIVSNQVLAMMESNGGSLDTRETERVKCVRNRMIGTHMVTRVCYTLDEYNEMVTQNQQAYLAKFGASKCLDRDLCRNRQPVILAPDF